LIGVSDLARWVRIPLEPQLIHWGICQPVHDTDGADKDGLVITEC